MQIDEKALAVANSQSPVQIHPDHTRKLIELYEAAKAKEQPDDMSPVLCKAMKALEDGFFYSDYDEACVYFAAIKRALATKREAGALAILKQIVKEWQDNNTLFSETATEAEKLITEIEGQKP